MMKCNFTKDVQVLAPIYCTTSAAREVSSDGTVSETFVGRGCAAVKPSSVK